MPYFKNNSCHIFKITVQDFKLIKDDRYDANQMLKKRSQSGTSIMKGMASQLSVPRSHSDERSISPSLINVEKRHSNQKQRSKGKNSSSKPTFSQLDEGDEESFAGSGNNFVCFFFC